MADARDIALGLELVVSSGEPSSSVTAVGHFARADGDDAANGLDRSALQVIDFDGRTGTAAVVPSGDRPVVVAGGVGSMWPVDVACARKAAAAIVRAVPRSREVAVRVPSGPGVGRVAQAVVEGALLARYRFGAPPRDSGPDRSLRLLQLLVSPGEEEEASIGAERGRVFAASELLARELADTPHSHLTATDFGARCAELGRTEGFAVELLDRDALIALGCGGLLAINAGSSEPPLMVRLEYRPADAVGHLGLVGKGIMYDSGGLSLKPSDMVHARMKNDMSGAGASLAVVAGLARLREPVAVTALLPCTDNMPSGTATALGDVVTIRGGTTVEIVDTDAEGRVVMADALALVTEAAPDAIVDIATLTGSCSRALGSEVAGVFGTSIALVDLVRDAAVASDEPVWELPLHRPYRRLLDSEVADLRNCGPVGLPDAILASLFLAEFVGDVPWVHLDIAGTAWSDADEGWRSKGATGFGTRLLLELARSFRRDVARR